MLGPLLDRDIISLPQDHLVVPLAYYEWNKPLHPWPSAPKIGWPKKTSTVDLLWLLPDPTNWAGPDALSKAVHALQNYGRGQFWLHWVGDSLDIKGPLTVLVTLLDGLLYSMTGKARLAYCARISNDGQVTVEPGRRGYSGCGFEEYLKKHHLTGGLKASGSMTNLWQWKISEAWVMGHQHQLQKKSF
jgi:hypothetical protein